MSPNSSIYFDPSLVDKNGGYGIIVTAAIMTPLILLSTIGRISMKLYHKIPIRTEDYLIVLGLVRMCPSVLNVEHLAKTLNS
jgi:hypothetical protein